MGTTAGSLSTHAAFPKLPGARVGGKIDRIGEPALIPTAPAILGAIDHATGARLTRVPATPDRVLAALKALALVRKLAVPALQINLAKKQVNVVTPAVVTPGASG